MLLLIDNHDSFTYNLKQYLSKHDQVLVLKNDDPTLFQVADKANALIYSPGPGRPEEANAMLDMIKTFSKQKPILGVCLGHQALALSFGGKLSLAKEVMHGKEVLIKVDRDSTLFQGLPEQVKVMRYHSYIVSELPKAFQITARTINTNEVMAIEHQSLPLYGLQFHPESIGTPLGQVMIDHFINSINDKRFT
ncbi:hypothetical protein HMPREF9318_01832 [Streptococcus urinalis FB127-CNA-2]|uniref:Glutamine amidotransferase, class I n=1 Tax=Streptococcus urinalis 2285-97 TaxID=764291 RepID=G5KDT5_9STRE|nr:aminodeoxychorismate/anthranilate synthase component II [Streptococcus urinalis]EHJ57512.1 glutamine amidotransferase, class I [Streptococcus urinalis 2285-97]EKS17383.1 hypothetical protein HMPREF9318_01832 [Streptococcus urinalis FB127-CNA-2]VEF32794.1 anthranilate synthase component II [Streptococcus urinalis]